MMRTKIWSNYSRRPQPFRGQIFTALSATQFNNVLHCGHITTVPLHQEG
jgi:hypothetical protein